MTNVVLTDPLLNSTKEFFDNPYPALKKLRETAPVMWSEKGEYWLVTKYDHAHEVLGDLQFEKGARKFKAIDTLAKIFPVNKLTEQRGKNMLNSNPPDHTRMRGLVNKAFTPSRIAEMRTHIEAIANELLDAVQSKGKMDLMADFAFPLPAIVISEMLGIPPRDRDRFKHWSHTITTATDPNPNPKLFDMAKVLHAYGELNSYLEPLIEERRKEKRQDLISALVAAEEGGDRLSTPELLSNIVLLLIAGHETTTNLIGNGTLALLLHQDQKEKLVSNFELLPTAISECLRYDSPVQLIRRIASEDVELGGQKIKEGQALLLANGACNRDPEVFPNPDVFDIVRSPNKHLAFGHGIHHCLGSSLAETEGQIAIRTLFTRMPKLKLATQKWEFKHPFALRGLKELPVSL
ncbi:MAG TPA: cytochrome P450 [Candidatus Obscuribacterales bacterium]